MEIADGNDISFIRAQKKIDFFCGCYDICIFELCEPLQVSLKCTLLQFFFCLLKASLSMGASRRLFCLGHIEIRKFSLRDPSNKFIWWWWCCCLSSSSLNEWVFTGIRWPQKVEEYSIILIIMLIDKTLCGSLMEHLAMHCFLGIFYLTGVEIILHEMLFVVR